MKELNSKSLFPHQGVPPGLTKLVHIGHEFVLEVLRSLLLLLVEVGQVKSQSPASYLLYIEGR